MKIAIPIVLALMISPAYASPPPSIDEVISATEDSLKDNLKADISFAKIRSPSELTFYIESNKFTPFDYLSERNKKRFIEKLTFNKSGLTGFSYEELLSIRPAQAYEILSLFGVQRTIGSIPFESASEEEEVILKNAEPILLTDYPGYRCTPPSTCSRSATQICLSTCANP